MANDPYETFRRAVACADEKIDLARAALAIAADDYPCLDVAGYLSKLDRLASEVTERIGSEANVYRSIAGLNDVLFQRHGYRGNRSEYFDDEKEIVIDPFNGGEVHSTESLENLLRQLFGRKIALHSNLLEAVTKKQILRRMLNNLKGIYLRANDWLKGLATVERLLILEPGSAEDLRDRGTVLLKLECFGQALADFETYLRVAPEAEDALAVKAQVVNLAKQVTQIH